MTCLSLFSSTTSGATNDGRKGKHVIRQAPITLLSPKARMIVVQLGAARTSSDPNEAFPTIPRRSKRIKPVALVLDKVLHPPSSRLALNDAQNTSVRIPLGICDR